MHRTLLALVACATVGVGWAQDEQHKDGPRVKVLSQSDLAEKVDGKKAKATTVEVTLEPGQSSKPHRHPGPVFGYVIEGDYEWAIDDKPAKNLKTGDTFYEPSGCLHRVSKNPSKTARTRVLAILLHPEEAKELAIPESNAARTELEGTWVGVSLVTAEGKRDDDYAGTIRWTIAGNQLTYKEKVASIRGTFHIDATASPKTFDAEGKQGIVSFAWAGIYELRGDT
jgi:uncharacterized protein (TIGR03067 family)